MKWLRDNWILIIIALIILCIVAIVLTDITGYLGYKKKIKESNVKILKLEKDNKAKDVIITEALKAAMSWERKAEAKEAIVAERDITIQELREKEGQVEDVIAELPPSEIVSRTIEILDCAEIKLLKQTNIKLFGQDDDQLIVFSLECAKKNLGILEKFSLVKEDRDLLQLSLTDCQEALIFQKMATFNIYRIAWAQGTQIMNWREMYKEKEYQFDLCEKYKRKAWLNGLWKGFVVGVIITVAVKVLFGK